MRAAAPTPFGSNPRGGTAVAAGLLVLLVGPLYLPFLNAPYHYDDRHVLLENPHLTGEESPGWKTWLDPNNRPAVLLSFRIQQGLAGGGMPGPAAFRWGNLLLHGTASILLLLLARRLGLSLFGALAAASLFAIHPLQTESVTYLSGRSEGIVVACGLGAAVWLLRGGTILSIAAGVVPLTLAALYAKQSAVAIPLLLLLLDRLHGPEAGKRTRLRRLHLPILGAIAAATLFHFLPVLADGSGGTSSAAYLLTEAKVIPRYLAKLLFPANLSIDYDVPIADVRDPTAVLSLALLVAAATASTWGIVHRKRWALLPAGFLVALAPTSSLVPLDEPMADHRTYLAGIPLFLGIGALLSGLDRRRPGATVPALLLLWIGFGAGTIDRNGDWNSVHALWAEGMRTAPASAKSHVNFATTLVPAETDAPVGEVRPAARSLRRAIEADPTHVEAYASLGAILARLGEHAAAEHYYRCALLLHPRHRNTRENIVTLYDHVLGQVREQLDRDPRNPGLHRDLAKFLRSRSEFADDPSSLSDAEQHARDAVRFAPDDPRAWGVLADVRAALGDGEGADAAYQRSLDLDQTNPGVWIRRGDLHRSRGDPAKAETMYMAACQNDPDHFMAYLKLADLAMDHGDRAGAERNLAEAIARAPNHVETLVRLDRYRRTLQNTPP